MNNLDGLIDKNGQTVRWKDNPKLYNKLWREKNKEILKVKQKEYYKNNFTSFQEYNKLWRKNNTEKINQYLHSEEHLEYNREYQKKRKLKNPEQYQKMRKEYADRNKEKIKEYNRIWQENHKDNRKTNPNIKTSKKKWRDNNKEYYKLYHERNKEIIRAQRKEYAKIHNETIIDYKNQYYLSNKEIITIKNKVYHDSHKDYFNKLLQRKRAEDCNYRLTINLKNRIWAMLNAKGINKARRNKSAIQLLGVDIPTLKAHLESQFTEGMSWENYGKWEVDHIYPISKFNLLNPEEQKICFYYKNLRPLWESDNVKKHAKLPSNHVEHLAFLRKEVYGEIEEVKV